MSLRSQARYVAAASIAGVVIIAGPVSASSAAGASDQQGQAATAEQAAAPGTLDATDGPLKYVALGDSYSAGSGILPLAQGAPLLCLQADKNYPKVIAAQAGANLTDVTCGAANSGHVTESQYPGVAPQLDAVTEDTDLVTLTIGGNDNSVFIGAILACGSAGLVTGGKGSPCKDIWGTHFDDKVTEKTFPAVKDALNAIQEKAPNAEVAILGYPHIVPEQADKSCFAKMPIAEGDVPYMRSLQNNLNSVIERAANETGATFVDMAEASDGHDACAPADKRWIEPVLFGSQVVPVHPNVLGETRMAEETMTKLGLN